MKRLLLARHAKSDWNHPELSDFDRPLNQRGEHDAPKMAEHLQECGYLVHQIISSHAQRALSTAQEYDKQLAPVAGLITHNDLYLASAGVIIQLVKSIPESSSSVMLVGHNPGMTEALNYFVHNAVQDMPTCSVAVIQFEVTDWKNITSNCGDILAFKTPKTL